MFIMTPLLKGLCCTVRGGIAGVQPMKRSRGWWVSLYTKPIDKGSFITSQLLLGTFVLAKVQMVTF